MTDRVTNLVKGAEILSESNGIVGRLAQPSDAESVVEMYEAALGRGGISAPGFEPYPDPSLFCVDGMSKNIEDTGRSVLVAMKGEQAVGGMIVDWLSPVHCENNCMAVRVTERGSGIGSLLVKAASALLQQTMLTINCTELVTHNLCSQAAHFNAGYQAICGFGYAHYPRVFFETHPESVLWTWRAFGKGTATISDLRKQGLQDDFADIRAQVTERLPDAAINQIDLLASLVAPRTMYICSDYTPLCITIVSQLSSLLNYTIRSVGFTDSERTPDGSIRVDPKDGYEHAYIDLNPDYHGDLAFHSVQAAFEAMKRLGKRFILVRMSANNPECPSLTRRLQGIGFFFHSLLPVYRLQDSPSKTFTDILALQWVSPQVIASNALPGETNSVIKLYGYPTNLTGDIIRLIRREINQ